MTAFDITIVVILAVSVLIGVYRGFVRELLSLAALAAALVVAVKFSELPKVWLPDFTLGGYTLTGGDVQIVVVFSLLFIAVLIVGRFVNNAVSGAVRRSAMSLFDRLTGAVFGFARGGVIVLALALFSGLTPVAFSDGWRMSLLIPPFEQLARYAMCYVPENYQNSHYLCAATRPGEQQWD